MFNPEFYPTPAEVIEIMLQGEEIENKTISSTVEILLERAIKEKNRKNQKQ